MSVHKFITVFGTQVSEATYMQLTTILVTIFNKEAQAAAKPAIDRLKAFYTSDTHNNSHILASIGLLKD